MKTSRILLALALAAPTFAFAQSNSALASQNSAGAINSGVNVNSYSSPFTAGTLDNHFRTNQAAAAAPAFGVQGMGCVKPGKGGSLQTVGAGVSLAWTGEMDEGCEAPRDINTMAMAGPGVFSADDKARRACAVPSIAKASPAACQRVLNAVAPAPAVALLP